MILLNHSNAYRFLEFDDRSSSNKNEMDGRMEKKTNKHIDSLDKKHNKCHG